MFRRVSEADPFERPLAYRRWMQAQYQKSRRPSLTMTLIGILAAAVLMFICSVPCLIVSRLLFR